ncbi:MAG TPA: SDR family NAD(P)-dependent oxidoreductase [Acidimicrobiales bacterium]|jgi:NAD(P)-dependent dehydrogenase (short-subunit alcohol dehydrogenase family)|nr:SDR family NAD(P)-dependent oxidoreductase [Acidimicrobiales bacterium]
MTEQVLAGRVALVTGASRGIGAAIAERFARAGATVVVSARTVDPSTSPFEGTINETTARIQAAGGTAIAIPADLSKPEDRERLVAEAVSRVGPVDVLVNNAAVTYFVPVAGFAPKRLQLMLDVQVVAPLHLAQLVLPGMTTQGRGWILNVSSGAARHPEASAVTAGRAVGGTVYGMCKAALERFTTGLAAEVYPQHVAVNALSPNRVVPTPGTLFHHLVRPEDPDQVVEPPSVMAEAALALCSVEPTSRTGRVTYSQDLLDELGIAVADGADAGSRP